jgi:peptide-methionine (S)-S-oxide reductase
MNSQINSRNNRQINSRIDRRTNLRLPTLPLRALLAVAAVVAVALAAVALAAMPAVTGEAAESAAPLAAHAQQTAVFAGGCFWGVDAVFKHVKGVDRVVSGYAGGQSSTAQYETVSTGTTGHAESVEVIYDPSQVSYGDLLEVFFYVAHDPTELDRQGPDSGTQYRSAIFFTDAKQKKIADAYIAQLDRAKAFSGPIVTQVVPLKGFYPAEAYHQNYLERHPDNPYIAINDLPKLDLLREKFPGIYKP